MTVRHVNYQQSARRMTALLFFLVGIILVIALYYVKIRAQTAQDEAARLERQIVAEQNAIKVLEAEIAILESPDRLRRLSKKHLGLEPIAAENVVEISKLSDTLEEGGQ